MTKQKQIYKIKHYLFYSNILIISFKMVFKNDGKTWHIYVFLLFFVISFILAPKNNEKKRKPVNEIMTDAMNDILTDIETSKHKDKMLELIGQFKAIHITVDNVDEWSPIFKEIVRLKNIPLQSKNRKKKKSKHRKQ